MYTGAVGAKPYFIDHHGGFFALDRSNGKIVWRYPMPAVEGAMLFGVASSSAVDRGRVFFGGLDGKFYAFRAE